MDSPFLIKLANSAANNNIAALNSRSEVMFQKICPIVNFQTNLSKNAAILDTGLPRPTFWPQDYPTPEHPPNIISLEYFQN